ncbi:uncharacterized protein MELLADRAFT_114145 [Melampsora larici-populina 98AG31]|uniref:Uncharacterized protein n=1 Tax=Melampsora larici-populina (strain 98AG31 / pathotype 3-4-7) TaxID=747676 RepID=F4SCB9_MELLP|nr:uncharacterized protein MELLADRAFT_114145 [Melampsora larici-populina 98AG31]EGF97708.1 hypothetical protein MELLADRAFT_114145 [Melampsora larici-populina 98AG31]
MTSVKHPNRTNSSNKSEKKPSQQPASGDDNKDEDKRVRKSSSSVSVTGLITLTSGPLPNTATDFSTTYGFSGAHPVLGQESQVVNHTSSNAPVGTPLSLVPVTTSDPTKANTLAPTIDGKVSNLVVIAKDLGPAGDVEAVRGKSDPDAIYLNSKDYAPFTATVHFKVFKHWVTTQI